MRIKVNGNPLGFSDFMRLFSLLAKVFVIWVKVIFSSKMDKVLAEEEKWNPEFMEIMNFWGSGFFKRAAILFVVLGRNFLIKNVSINDGFIVAFKDLNREILSQEDSPLKDFNFKTSAQMVTEAAFAAAAEAEKSGCLRAKMGAAIFANVNTIEPMFVGFNQHTTEKSCAECGECLLNNKRCVRTKHAEICALEKLNNYLNSKGITGEDRMKYLRNCYIVVTSSPCAACLASIKESGISRIVFIIDRYKKDGINRHMETEEKSLELGMYVTTVSNFRRINAEQY